MPDANHTGGGLSYSNSGNFVLSELQVAVRRANSDEAATVAMAKAFADYEQPGHLAKEVIDGRTDGGWAVWSGEMQRRRQVIVVPEEPIDLEVGDVLEIKILQRSVNPGHSIGRFRVAVSEDEQPSFDQFRRVPLSKLTGLDSLDQLAEVDRAALLTYYLSHDGRVGAARGALRLAERTLADGLQQLSVRVMVLRERSEPRKTHVLLRGEWDQHGEEVSPEVPELLGAIQSDTPRNRVTLARWLVHRDNPLTARVAVNRFWQEIFGYGLVRTPEDFGLQGERPTHPELLDWLAIEFIESGWDMKALLKTIVMSARRFAKIRVSAVSCSNVILKTGSLLGDLDIVCRQPRFETKP